MKKLFDKCILNARDIGIEKYSVNEIAIMMKPSNELVEKSSLFEFASSIYDLFESKEDSNCLINNSSGLTEICR